MCRLESVLILSRVHISVVPSGNCSVPVHSTLSWCAFWKVFCFCAQYTFLIYRLESVMFLYAVHISGLPSWKCSVSVHNVHFYCTVWKLFCICTQYTCFMYLLESVLFLCILLIPDVPSGKCSVFVQRTHIRYLTMWYLDNQFLLKIFCFSHWFVAMLPYCRHFHSRYKHVTLQCYRTADSSIPWTNMFLQFVPLCECDLYKIFGLHPF